MEGGARTSDGPWPFLAHLSNELFSIVGIDGHTRLVSPSAEWVLGYRPDALAQVAGLGLVHPDDQPALIEVWSAVTASVGATGSTECRLRHRHQGWRWFELDVHNLIDEPVIDGIVFRFYDITDRHLAQSAVQASEEQFRTLVQHSFDVISVADADFNVTFISPAVTSSFGYLPEDVLGQKGVDWIHPDDLEPLIGKFAGLLERPGGTDSNVFRIRHADGGYRWVECMTVNLLDQPGLNGLVVNFRDITDRRLAEDELRDSEQRLQALLRNAEGVTVIMDSEARVLWASPQAGRLWGLTDTEFVGHTQDHRIHPDDVRRVARQYRKVLETPGGSARVEVRMQHQDGTWRWFEAIYTNCLDDPSVKGIIANTRDITERALADQALRHSEERLEHQATHDDLTGLPNRTLLLDRADVALARAKRNGSSVALLLLDLDHFKVVNDSQGHDTGDRLLVEVAERLRTSVRPADTVARFGGDEFIVLCEDLGDATDAIVVAEHLLQALRTPFGDAEAYLDASIGIAVRTGADLDADTTALIRDADAAMYQAKARGRGRFELFDDELRSRAVQRHRLQTGLRHALDDEQFSVHYQPIIALRGGREPSGDLADQMVGAEALVRWQHPEQGLLLPGTFIGHAEETGLIVPIGQSVLATACRFWTTRDVATSGDPPPFLSVNLSARQLAEPDLLSEVARVLDQTGLPPERLHLEITESALMLDPDTSAATLDRLKSLGVRIAVDDFGTGYSSFSYLRRFPVDLLKIDKTFIDDITTDERDRTLVIGMVQLGHTLGLTVVAEGVETDEQLEALVDSECDMAQGFLFAHPLPPADIDRWMGP